MENYTRLNKQGGPGWNMFPKIDKRAFPFIRKVRVWHRVVCRVTYFEANARKLVFACAWSLKMGRLATN